MVLAEFQPPLLPRIGLTGIKHIYVLVNSEALRKFILQNMCGRKVKLNPGTALLTYSLPLNLDPLTYSGPPNLYLLTSSQPQNMDLLTYSQPPNQDLYPPSQRPNLDPLMSSWGSLVRAFETF